MPRLLTALCVIVALAAPAAADSTPLDKTLDRLIDQAALTEAIGVHVVAVSDGTALYSKNADKRLNPASNMKLLTAFSALKIFGPAYRFETVFRGSSKDGQIGTLVVQGSGDPSIRYSNLLAVAKGLQTLGARAIDTVAIDASIFDRKALPPGFEQQPKETALFRAAVGAFAVDRAAYRVTLAPGARVGDPVFVDVSAPWYVTVVNTATTIKKRDAIVIVQEPMSAFTMRMRVAGTLPVDAPTHTFGQRVIDPLSHAGLALIDALQSQGLEAGSLTASMPKKRGRVVWRHRSPPIHEILDMLGKRSDNFTAEMLLKGLGAQAGVGSSEAGLTAVRQQLSQVGINPARLTLFNGSGLFVGNKLCAATLTRLLRAAYNDPEIGPEFVSHLAVSGIDGTLRRRKGLPPKIVRAKTGTLRDVVALSGYVLGKTPNDTLAFSILLNDIEGKIGPARKLTDQIVTAIAKR